MEELTLRRAAPCDAGLLAELMLLLWPGHTAAALMAENDALLRDGGQALFLAFCGGEAAGFAHCALRHDYVEGCGDGPVGYMEGLYVRPAQRRRGVARALTRACEDWARAQGCTEMGSDCELTNTLSPLFHAGLGFAEVNRVICFRKAL